MIKTKKDNDYAVGTTKGLYFITIIGIEYLEQDAKFLQNSEITSIFEFK